MKLLNNLNEDYFVMSPAATFLQLKARVYNWLAVE